MTQARVIGFKCEKPFCDVKHLNDKDPKHSWFILRYNIFVLDFSDLLFTFRIKFHFQILNPRSLMWSQSFGHYCIYNIMKLKS